MENSVSYQVFYWTIGALISIITAVIGYWISEVKKIGTSLDDHEKEDEKEFMQSQLKNEKEHAEIKAMLAEKIHTISKEVLEVKGDVGQINTKLDYIKDFIKEIKDTNFVVK